MAEFDVRFDDVEVKRLIDKLITRVEKPKSLLTELGRYIRAMTMKMFRDRRPDRAMVRGVKWKKLKEATIKRKRAKGYEDRPLVASRKMRDSLARGSALKVDNRGLEYGTEVKSKRGFPYPGLHNVGDRGKIPQRKWLFLTKADLRQMLFTTKEYLEGRLRKMKVR